MAAISGRPGAGRLPGRAEEITAQETVTPTVNAVLLLSRTRPEGIATLIVLPPGTRILAHFTDDKSTRDITAQAADLITEYILRGGDGGAADADSPGVEVARLELDGSAPVTARMALIDLQEDRLEEIPAERLLPLLSGAITMAVSDAVAANTNENAGDGAADNDNDGAPVGV